jgi:hypothetical protein
MPSNRRTWFRERLCPVRLSEGRPDGEYVTVRLKQDRGVLVFPKACFSPIPNLNRTGIMEEQTCDYCSVQPVYAEYPCAEPTPGRTVKKLWGRLPDVL